MAERATVSKKDIDEIKTSLKALETDVQTLLTTKAVQEKEHEYILEHRDILKGKDKEPGLIAQVDRHERFITNISNVLMALVMLFLAELVGVIFFIIRLSSG